MAILEGRRSASPPHLPTTRMESPKLTKDLPFLLPPLRRDSGETCYHSTVSSKILPQLPSLGDVEVNANQKRRCPRLLPRPSLNPNEQSSLYLAASLNRHRPFRISNGEPTSTRRRCSEDYDMAFITPACAPEAPVELSKRSTSESDEHGVEFEEASRFLLQDDSWQCPLPSKNGPRRCIQPRPVKRSPLACSESYFLPVTTQPDFPCS